MLRVEDVWVSFGGVQALHGVDMDVPAGSVTGLIGPNGAGKTTLFDVITGLRRPQRGRVRFAGQDVTGLGARARSKLGMARTFQRLELFGSLSVMDNVLVAVENRGLRGARARLEAESLIERVGLSGVAERQADVLPTGQARLLELVRALACRPRAILLDEPFSGVDAEDAGRLAALLRELAASGLAVLLVEHDVQMVMSICAAVTVLALGGVITAGTPDQVRADSRVQEAYLGAPAGAV